MSTCRLLLAVQTILPYSCIIKNTIRLNIALASTLEEEPDNKHLQCSHADNQSNLDHAKVDNALLRAGHGAEVAILSCSKVLLVSGNGGKLARDFVDGFLQDGCLFWR